MKILELFAGSRSIGKVAEKRGHEVFSIDWEPYDNIDLVIDILDLTKEMLPWRPDAVWGSPDCTTYSIAAISHHRNGIFPKSKKAIIADKVTQKTLDIFKWYPDAFYAMENPRGMMRKMPFVKNMERVTVTYCSYGDFRMKPTDIWGNFFYSAFNPEGWSPRPMCFNKNPHCHHEYSPRGTTVRKIREETGVDIGYNGTGKLRSAHERSKIPEELCLEIIESWEKQLTIKNLKNGKRGTLDR